ncbi:uncharacterized protein JCM10292_001254 [Rhodotorula paludigena]|uniref:uncharacterized protein n=1 Tax=Rhodotorula paludigena TaxID=86838 RepID=UPI00317499D4
MVREIGQPSAVEESDESVDWHLAQAGELLPDVKRLASSGCVLLPGPSEPHTTLRELLVCLYASAAQRSIIVERADDADDLHCQRQGSAEVDTSFRLEITRGDDGAWRVRRTAAHSDPRPQASGVAQQLKPAEVAPASPTSLTVKTGPTKRKRAACEIIDLTTSPPPSSCLNASSHAAPVPRRPSPSPLLVRLRLPSTCSLTTSPPSSTIARRGSTSSSADPLAAPFRAQLIAVLVMLVPFLPIQQHLDAAEALVRAGVSSHSELAALCCLSWSARDELVATLVEEDARAKLMSEEAAQGMRRSLRRILDTLGRAKDEAAQTE